MQCSSGSGAEPTAPVEGVLYAPLVQADLDQVLAIEAVSFACPWERCHFDLILRPSLFAVNRVARLESRVLAYLCAVRSDGEFKINNLAVAEASRRRGLGRWMLERALAEARATGCGTALLEVRPSNAAALGLYSGLGFAELGRLCDYYREEGEDAIVMRALLEEPR